jgi:hypothetical protein
LLPSTKCVFLKGEKRRDDKTILLGLAVDDHQIFPWFDLPDRKQFAPIPGENRRRIGNSFHNLCPEARQFIARWPCIIGVRAPTSWRHKVRSRSPIRY